NAARSNRMRNSSSMELIISNIPKESITPLRRKSKLAGTSTGSNPIALIGSEYFASRNWRTFSGLMSLITCSDSPDATERVPSRRLSRIGEKLQHRSDDPDSATSEVGRGRKERPLLN